MSLTIPSMTLDEFKDYLSLLLPGVVEVEMEESYHEGEGLSLAALKFSRDSFIDSSDDDSGYLIPSADLTRALVGLGWDGEMSSEDGCLRVEEDTVSLTASCRDTNDFPAVRKLFDLCEEQLFVLGSNGDVWDRVGFIRF